MTLAAGVPTIWMGVLDELDGRDLSSLKRILCGGSAVPKALSEAYREKTGMPILHAWGMTETSPLGSVCHIKSTLRDLSEEEKADVRATQGIASPLVECRIVAPESDDEQPWDGEARGELQCAGPWVAAAYYGDEGESQFTDDGWLRTGDVAVITPEGYIKLVDRTKDLVKSGGEWISSVELENEIMAHPKVKEAAVIGIRDEKWGERPLACVVAEDGEDVERRRHQDVPRRPRGQVVDPGVVRVHRRGPEDVGRQVLQEDAARAVRRGGDLVSGISQDELQLAARNHGMPLEALRWPVTPLGLHYLLIHYDIPVVDPEAWRLRVGGRVERELSLSLADLRERPAVTRPVTMECAGNGRARFEPHIVSQPWLSEAVGNAEWTGVPVRDLLDEAGVADGAVEVLFTGLDRGVEGGVEQSYQRSLPLEEALDGPLLAYAVNGVDAAAAARLPAAAAGAGLVRHDEREVAGAASTCSTSRSPATSRRSATACARTRTTRGRPSRGSCRAR